MPLVYQQNINESTKIGVWHIAEPEDFFTGLVPLQRNITHPHKRLQHLAGRLLLKELYPDFPVEWIQVADTRKPFLENEPYHFSISHCGDYAAALVSREYRVGVDIELVGSKIEKVKHKFLSEGEQQILNAHAEIFKAQSSMLNTQSSIFNERLATLCWSVKESVYKWQGSGGMDYKKDMRIINITGNAFEGFVHCVFKDAMELQVHYLHFNDHYLTWLITGH